MVIRDISEAQADLFSLIEQVLQGQEVVLANAGRPMAKLIPYRAPTQPRKPGSMRGEIWIAPDFDTFPDDVAASFGSPE